MLTSFTTMGTPGLSVDEIVNVAKVYSFDSVEIRVLDDGEIKKNISDEEIKQIRKKLSVFDSFGLLCYNITISENKEKMVENVLNNLEFAEKTGAERIRVFTGKIITSEMMSELISALKSILEAYKGRVQINLQNHSGNGLSCAQGIELINKLKDDRLGFIFSPDESLKNGEDYMSCIEEITKISRQIYVADMTKEMKYCLIGEGIIPFNDIISQMKRNGFDGIITLKWEKCWHDYLPDYTIGFPSFKNIVF